MAFLGYILTGLLGYGLGSIPTGFLVGKARGVDIRTVGSGNIGATNVFRHLGKPAGALVMVVDAVKGWLAVVVMAKLVCNWFCPGAESRVLERFEVIAGIAAILGHNYTCWLNFKGGKGIATSAGVLSALVPWSLVIILIVWIVVLGLTRFVSLASIAASATLPVAAWVTGESATLIAITGGMGALAIYKHKANLKRLMNGTEHRLGRPKPERALPNEQRL